MKFKKLLKLILTIYCLAINSLSIASKHYSAQIHEYTTPIYLSDNALFFDEYDRPLYFAQYEGKAVLIVFWALWCPLCLQKMADLDSLKKDFKKLPLEVLPISSGYRAVADIKEFYKDNKIKYLNIFYDNKNKLMNAMEVIGLPSAFLVDEDGRITHQFKGVVDWNDDEIRDIILSTIPGKPARPKNSNKQTIGISE